MGPGCEGCGDCLGVPAIGPDRRIGTIGEKLRANRVDFMDVKSNV
jgi:hypothetical protein